MKPRLYFFALLALLVVVGPAALAQRTGVVESGEIGYIPHPGLGGAVTRVFTSAVLLAPDGTVVGKAKTAVVTTAERTVQGLRVQATTLAPNTEYALVVDNTLVGTETTNANGVLKMRFSDPAGRSGNALPEALKPISTAQAVALYEVSSQRLVASGQFSTGGAPK